MPRQLGREFAMSVRNDTGKTTKPLTKTQASQAYKIAKKAVDRLSEVKSHYHARTTDYEITTSNPLLIDFLNIPVGTFDSDRQGDEIIFKHLKINLDIQGSVDGVVKYGKPIDRVRVMLIRWKEPDMLGGVSNPPTALKIFGYNLPLGSNLFTAMVNREENGRAFKVLFDKNYTLAGDITNMSNCDSPERKRAFVSLNVDAKKYGLQKVKYDNINPSDNNHMNGVWLYVLTDNTGGATISGPTVSYDSRLLFKEL